MTDRAQPTVVAHLAGRHLEAQVEQLFFGFAQLLDQLVVVELAQLARRNSDCHQNCSSRVTMRALIGSLWIARVSASRAVCSLGKLSSKRMRAGLTLAIHHYASPISAPMPVSRGFF